MHVKGVAGGEAMVTVQFSEVPQPGVVVTAAPSVPALPICLKPSQRRPSRATVWTFTSEICTFEPRQISPEADPVTATPTDEKSEKSRPRTLISMGGLAGAL